MNEEFKPTRLQIIFGVIFIICALGYAGDSDYQEEKSQELTSQIAGAEQ